LTIYIHNDNNTHTNKHIKPKTPTKPREKEMKQQRIFVANPTGNFSNSEQLTKQLSDGWLVVFMSPFGDGLVLMILEQEWGNADG
jgi:hypothetical protein